jgi:hypothetical protein
LRHDSEPPEIGDFGFFYPYNTVLLTVTMLKASNFVCWPEAGGMWDQDSNLIRDVLTYLSLERRVEFEQKEIDSETAGEDTRATEDLGFG